VVVIRPPLVYGPGVKGNFASLIRWVTRATPLPLGAVRNSRSLIGLSNLVEFTTLCADINASPNAAGEVFLVSDGEDISTTELLRRVATAYGHSSRLLPVPAWLLRGAARLVGRSAQADRLLGSLLIDDSKAREVLGWTPPVNIDEQLRRMAAGPAAANAGLSTPAASRTGAGVIGADRTSPNG
jgi:nucleoside-diphosphate-sugar epimerase